MIEIPLTQGKVALVDNEDYYWLNQWKWSAHYNYTKWYAVRNDKGKIVKMHRLIISAGIGDEIDHKDGDSLNNCRSNLRFVTRAQNLQNRRANRNSTSQYIGVYWENYTSKWCAAIKKDGKTKKIGRFDSEEDAARARDQVAKEWGFLKMNFPEEI